MIKTPPGPLKLGWLRVDVGHISHHAKIALLRIRYSIKAILYILVPNMVKWPIWLMWVESTQLASCIMWILLLTSTFLPASLSSPQWDHLSRNGSSGSPRRVSKFLNLFSVVRWHFSIVVSDPYECNNFTSLKYFHVICLPCILSLSSKTNTPDFGTLVPSFQMYHFLSRFPNSGCSTHSGLNGTCYSETECRKRDGLVAGGGFLPRTVTFFVLTQTIS